MFILLCSSQTLLGVHAAQTAPWRAPGPHERPPAHAPASAHARAQEPVLEFALGLPTPAFDLRAQLSAPEYAPPTPCVLLRAALAHALPPTKHAPSRAHKHVHGSLPSTWPQSPACRLEVDAPDAWAAPTWRSALLPRALALLRGWHAQQQGASTPAAGAGVGETPHIPPHAQAAGALLARAQRLHARLQGLWRLERDVLLAAKGPDPVAAMVLARKLLDATRALYAATRVPMGSHADDVSLAEFLL